jgi:NAD(P)-dependent dehydrogenase (short-subunit alcohol dehydrogenase family)
LTKAVARELGKYSVNVNAVAPGMILTDMMSDLPEEVKQKAVDETVLGRLGAPEEVASVIAFLSRSTAGNIFRRILVFREL